MYPSISICKKYAFDNANLNFFDYDYMDIDKAVEWIAHYSWSLEDTVYFFTHPGALNMTFPCTTTLGGGASNEGSRRFHNHVKEPYWYWG